MKIYCECGEEIPDQTDALPYKGHVIPDENWFAVFDAIDQVISDVAAGRKQTEDAFTAIRCTLDQFSNDVYRCEKCGRLLVFQGEGCQVYLPADPARHLHALALAAAAGFEREQEAVKGEAIRLHNEAARIVAQKMEKQGLRCPHCLRRSYGMQFVDRSPTGWSFFQCPACSRTFRLENFKDSGLT